MGKYIVQLLLCVSIALYGMNTHEKNEYEKLVAKFNQPIVDMTTLDPSSQDYAFFKAMAREDEHTNQLTKKILLNITPEIMGDYPDPDEIPTLNIPSDNEKSTVKNKKRRRRPRKRKAKNSQNVGHQKLSIEDLYKLPWSQTVVKNMPSELEMLQNVLGQITDNVQRFTVIKQLWLDYQTRLINSLQEYEKSSDYLYSMDGGEIVFNKPNMVSYIFAQEMVFFLDAELEVASNNL